MPRRITDRLAERETFMQMVRAARESPNRVSDSRTPEQERTSERERDPEHGGPGGGDVARSGSAEAMPRRITDRLAERETFMQMVRAARESPNRVSDSRAPEHERTSERERERERDRDPEHNGRSGGATSLRLPLVQRQWHVRGASGADAALLGAAQLTWGRRRLRELHAGFAAASASSTSAMDRWQLDPDDMTYEELLELNPGNLPPRGATLEEIVQLPPPCLVEEGATAENCAICLMEMGEGCKVRRLPRCGHVFHAGCIDQWLRQQFTCPVCRQCLIGHRRA